MPPPLLVLLLAGPAPQAAALGQGWARTKVDGAIFRHEPLTSFGDVQVASFYDPWGRLVLAPPHRAHARAAPRRTDGDPAA